VLVRFNDLCNHSIRISDEFIAITEPDNYTAVLKQVKYSDTMVIHLNTNINFNSREIQAHFISQIDFPVTMYKDYHDMYFTKYWAITTIPDNMVAATIRIAHSNYINLEIVGPIRNINLDYSHIQFNIEDYSWLYKDYSFDSRNHRTFYFLDSLRNQAITC
jgi:hypothetical protein